VRSKSKFQIPSLRHDHQSSLAALIFRNAAITMSGMINGGGSPYKKRKLLDIEANESKESIRLAEEETKLPENSAALSAVTNKTVAAALPNTTGVMLMGGMSLPALDKVTSATTSDDNTSANYSDTNTTVYVGGLHPVIQQAHVEKLLGKYGTIQWLDMLPNKHCCFCHYETRNQAHTAIANLHGRSLLKRTLKVQLENSKSSPRRTDATSSIGRRMPRQNKTRSLDDRIQALKRKLKKRHDGDWYLSLTVVGPSLLCFHDIQSKQRIKRDVSSIKDIKRAKK
jgi:RNA recognition motif-containing protein